VQIVTEMQRRIAVRAEDGVVVLLHIDAVFRTYRTSATDFLYRIAARAPATLNERMTKFSKMLILIRNP